MSIASLTSIHTITVLKPNIAQGASMGVERTYEAAGNIQCRVRPIELLHPSSHKTLMFFSENSQEVSHNLWFNFDPGLTEGDEVLWTPQPENVQIILRIIQTAKNLHGLGRIWVAGANSKRMDNIANITNATPFT